MLSERLYFGNRPRWHGGRPSGIGWLPDGRRPYALTAPTSVATQASAARRGSIEVVEVATGAAAMHAATGR